FEGNGPIKKMITESTSHGLVRGYIAHPEAEGERPMGDEGVLYVVKDVGLKDLIEGVVERKGSIESDIHHFLETSEQTQSLVSLATVQDEKGQVEISGGLMIQLLPDGDPAIIDQMADRLQELPPLGDMLKEGAENNPDVILETIADTLFVDTDSKTLEKRWLFFHCGCSRERSKSALISLGVPELKKLRSSHEDVVIDCHFCNEQFVFTRDDIKGLIDQLQTAN
ncbi:MAG: Hsp33 family molecular chaperone HslO, partial [Chloroflexota bacterium]